LSVILQVSSYCRWGNDVWWGSGCIWGDCGRWLVQLCHGCGLGGLPAGCCPFHALHFGFGALVLAGSFAGVELSSTCHALPLAGGLFSRFRRLPFPFSLSSTAPLLCKTPLLLLGIIGLTAARLEIEEGKVALSVEKLQNIYKHHLFHRVNRVRY
jgi:hypothetical protein